MGEYACKIRPFETEDVATFRDMIAKFTAKEITPYVNAWDEAETFPRELYRKAGALGLFGIGTGEEYGGLGTDDIFLRAALWQELARCGSGGVIASLLVSQISAPPVHAIGSEELKKRILPGVMSGEKIMALAITEPSGGSDVSQLQTRAVRDGDDYVLTGSKTFITAGMRADYYVVAARTNDEGMAGISLFLVEKDRAGFDQTLLHKMGWWCSDTASLFFDNCRIPKENLIGPENTGFKSVMKNFNLERMSLIAAANTSAEVCLNEAIAYAKDRTTFGKHLINHQVIRHKIADMTSKINASCAYFDQICWAISKGTMPVAEIAMAKVVATTMMEFCAREAMQILGGAGFMRGNPVERIYREVRVVAIGGGSEEIMRDLAVRQLGL